MVNMWVTRPGEEYELQEVGALAAKLQGEIAAIESLGDEGACWLCAERAALTREHAPAKKRAIP